MSKIFAITWTLVFGVALLLILINPQRSDATASQFCVSVPDTGVFTPGSECHTDIPAHVDGQIPTNDNDIPQMDIHAVSDGGGLHTDASGIILANPSGCCGTPNTWVADVYASWVKNVEFTGPGPLTTVSGNLHFLAEPVVTARGDTPPAFGDATINVSGSLGNFLAFNGSLDMRQCGVPVRCGPRTVTTSGILTPLSSPFFDATVTTRAQTVPTGVFIPYTLNLESVALLGWTGGSDIFLDVDANASHTLTFPSDGPVFNLPDGFTANSDDGTIVDNRFVGAGSPSSVPEPSTAMMVASGLAGLCAGVLRTRRPRRGASGANQG